MNINNYLKPGKSINVIAAAGTGKTWIIISKILRLLLDGVSPEKITAITFTRKSSAEMMERLNTKIELWSNLDLHALKIELNEIGITENIKVYSDKAKRLFVNIQLINLGYTFYSYSFLFLSTIFIYFNDFKKLFLYSSYNFLLVL